MSQQQFTELFQAEFASLIKDGLPKNEAAARAVAKVKEVMLQTAAGSAEVPGMAAGKTAFTEGVAVGTEAKKSKAEENFSPLTLSMVREMIADAQSSGVYSAVIKTCGRVFSSSDFLNQSFALAAPSGSDSESMEEEVEASKSSSSSTNSSGASAAQSGPIRVDIEAAAAIFAALLSTEHEGVQNSITHALEALSFNLQYSDSQVGGGPRGVDARQLVQYLVVLEHPGLQDPDLMTLLKNILLAVDKLPEDAQRLISEWIGQSAGVARYKRYLDTLQQYITLKLLNTEVDDCKVAARVMNLLYVQFERHYSGIDHANNCKEARAKKQSIAAHMSGPPVTISYKDFNNEILNEEFLRTRSGRKAEYSMWLLDIQKGGLLLRQRELEEEKRMLAIHHGHQQRYLEEQQKQQHVLENQKQELKKLQAQLQQLEANSSGGDSGGSAAGAVAGSEATSTPTQLEELRSLQARLQTLDGHLNRQRDTLATTSSRLQQQSGTETGAGVGAATTATAGANAVANVAAAGAAANTVVAAVADTVANSTAAAEPLGSEPDTSCTAEPSGSADTEVPATAAAELAAAPVAPSASPAAKETHAPIVVPPKRVDAPLPTAEVVTAVNRLTLWERLPYMKRESFLSYPFMLTAATKAEILEIEVQAEVQSGFQEDVAEARRRGQTHIVPYFILQVRREHVVMDTLNRILALSMMAEAEGRSSAATSRATARLFKKPLKIIFDNEEGIDAGGVRKEYYQLLTKKLLDPAFGMFTYNEDSKLLWFNPHGFENDQEFELIGLMVGIAIYNGIILDLRMPMATYKKLRGRRVNLQDLIALQPTVGSSLEKLLEYDGNDFEEVFGMRFEITVTMFDCPVSVELKPGGADMPVTQQNKHEYVDLYVQYVLEDSVKTQFDAFARGFRKVCNNSGMDLFKFEELELLICGNPVLNMRELRAGTKYEDGYTADSEVVQMFWTVVMDFDEEEKKQLLKFISGSDRSPIDGLAEMKFVISRVGAVGEAESDVRLPSAHTCFNHLLLPPYSSIDILRSKLKYAINHSEGFGLR